MTQSLLKEARAEETRPPLPGLSELDPEEHLQAIPGYEDYAEQVAHGIHELVLKGGPPARRVADFFHGTWLGHPLHSVLTDVTLGAWMFGSLMDVFSLTRQAKGARYAADRLIAIGTLSAIPTAVAGLTDYSTVPREATTTGATHGLINALALALYAVSMRSRQTGNRAAAMLYSGMGLGLILISAWLGGEMTYRYRVGVNRVEVPEAKKRWKAVVEEDELAEDEPQRVELDDQPVLLYRHQGRIYAIGAVCAHAGGPLEEGKFVGCQVECPWHHSVYDLETGRVVHGPATFSEPVYETRVRKGKVELRLRQ